MCLCVLINNLQGAHVAIEKEEKCLCCKGRWMEHISPDTTSMPMGGGEKQRYPFALPVMYERKPVAHTKKSVVR